MERNEDQIQISYPNRIILLYQGLVTIYLIFIINKQKIQKENDSKYYTLSIIFLIFEFQWLIQISKIAKAIQIIFYLQYIIDYKYNPLCIISKLVPIQPFFMSNSLNKLQEWKSKMLEKKKQEKNQNNVAGSGIQLLPLPQGLIPVIPALNMPQEKQSASQEEDKLSSLKEPQKLQRQHKSVHLPSVPDKGQQTQKQQLQIQKIGRGFSQNISSAPNKLNMDELGGENKKVVKLTRYLLKDIDKLKEAMANIEGSLRGIEYIRQRVQNDKLFHRKIKQKLIMLRENAL